MDVNEGSCHSDPVVRRAMGRLVLTSIIHAYVLSYKVSAQIISETELPSLCQLLPHIPAVSLCPSVKCNPSVRAHFSLSVS